MKAKSVDSKDFLKLIKFDQDEEQPWEKNNEFISALFFALQEGLGESSLDWLNQKNMFEENPDYQFDLTKQKIVELFLGLKVDHTLTVNKKKGTQYLDVNCMDLGVIKFNVQKENLLYSLDSESLLAQGECY